MPKKQPTTEPLTNAVLLPRDSIYLDAAQPRQHFDARALAELRESIRQHGVLQPLIVAHEPSGYDGTAFKLRAGERRYRASEGVLDKLPCIIADIPPQQARAVALAENIHRQDLTALEEARAIADMMTSEQLSARKVARALNVSDGWVNNRLALLKTGPDVQEVAARQPLAMSSLLLIDTVKDDAEERRELLELVEDGAPHSAIKSRIEERATEAKLLRQSRHAPDTQTEARSRLNERNGSGNMSRGRIVQTTSPREATAQVESAVSEIERQIRTLEAWRAHTPARAWKRAVEALQAQIDRLCDEE